MPKYVAAIDQGTTSTRCILFDHAGNIVSCGPKGTRTDLSEARMGGTRCPRNLGADPGSGAECIGKIRRGSGDIASIGITNQRETTVVWERQTGRPVCNAIVWQDTRTDAICNELARNGGQDRFRAKTGLPLATYFSGPKIKWILDNIPGTRQRAEKGELLFGNMDTWVLWNMTGVHVTDVTNASRTLLMDLKTLEWDEEILGHPGHSPGNAA